MNNFKSQFKLMIIFADSALLTTACNQPKKTLNESFVEVSSENPSYFCLSNGDTYIPNGLNICWARDMETMERYFRLLSENGCNYARVWLGHGIFDYETEYGQVNEERLDRVDKIFEIAGKYGIKIKLCLENFRSIAPVRGSNAKTSYHVDNGGPFTDMLDYMSDDRGQKVFLDRVMFFKNRYGDDPRVFAWEIWNEMNAIWLDKESMNKLLTPWNAAVLSKMQEIFPKNLVTQSLGSMDRESVFPHYEGIMRIPENDILQVHRYIDEGQPPGQPPVKLPIIRSAMDLMAVDAIEHLKSYGIRKPILLAETGGVEPNHSGLHRACRNDHDGIFLHDELFAPYFTGAAGPCHTWWWDVYVDRNNLWYHFRRFANVIEGTDPVEEGFELLRADQPGFRVYISKERKILSCGRETSKTHGWQNSG